MELNFSFAARNRRFSKAMRRIEDRFKPLIDAFELVDLSHPIQEAILVIITDDKGPEFFEEVENRDGYFQVIAGCSQRGSDDELAEDVFGMLLRAVRLCPFSDPDHQRYEAMFARLRPSVLRSNC
jgi:hypothetical protein